MPTKGSLMESLEARACSCGALVIAVAVPAGWEYLVGSSLQLPSWVPGCLECVRGGWASCKVSRPEGKMCRGKHVPNWV